MLFTGTVYEQVDSVLGTIVVEQLPTFIMVKITVAGSEILKFPLPLNSDSNEIIMRTQAIVNQTGFIKSYVRVVLTEVT